MSSFPSETDSRALFAPLPSTRSSERVAEAIRRVIIEGRILPGENLPPERTLAERFRVTRNTVREALRSLEQLRLVSIRQGSGIRVQDFLTTAGLELAAAMVTFSGDGKAAWMRDVAEARAVIGAAMLGHAIGRLDAAAVADVGEAIDAFVAEARGGSPDVARLQELDVEIHRRVVWGGGNRALALLHNSIRHVYEQVAPLFAPLMADPAALAATYELLRDALEQRDHEAARRIVRAYFDAGQAALAAAGDEGETS